MFGMTQWSANLMVHAEDIHMPTIFDLICENCGKEFQREKRQMTSSMLHEVKRFFCTRSCNVSYNNKHKEYGDMRSSIEMWIETSIKRRWPNLEVHYNRKDAIEAELDIYVPSLRLAFEINGRSHYEPIWGQDVFQKTLLNDQAKAEECKERGIELIVVDAGKFSAIKGDPNFEKIVNSVMGVLSARVNF